MTAAVTKLIALAGIISTGCFFFFATGSIASDWQESGSWNDVDFDLVASATLLLAWSLSPYFILWFLPRTDDPRWKQVVKCLAAALIVGVGADSYFDAVFVSVDAQSGLVFILAPLVLNALVGVTAFVASILPSEKRP